MNEYHKINTIFKRDMEKGNSNGNKIIIDLCGGTGSWSKPYKEAGYDVRVITLPRYDVTTYQLPKEPVYGILAAPECTQFSIARTTAKEPRDLRKGMILVEACMQLIWEARKRNKLAFWALENPRGLLRQFLGIPILSYQPDEYGELYTKHTDIWGYFKIPEKLKNKPIIPERVKMQFAKNNRILPELPEGYKPAYGRNQAARRSMTSPKFANAFFKANK